MSSAETPQTIAAFWFGELASDAHDAAVAERQAPLWWRKDPATDSTIRRRFEDVITEAAMGGLDAWAKTPAGRLALIVLTDQFPRNIHRDTPAAFRHDPLARAWCKEGLALGDDARLRPIERVFFYLPLEHSESLEDQERSVALYRALSEGVPAPQRAVFDGFLDFAVRHRDIVERFGRFPHRNRLLGRRSSPQELAFLEEPGSSF
jgi:uncharacterized protein (DUF924 family)